ncbi:MAG: hypothetical protein COV47_02840 [Candidatus Diapherotrites archaeon CG11_big_fil_rev_8_21_14_0_20_37_9]|nr:MAG: hypothetical protein COV47_02840 [Candidatus Diapherotrites archaeon CG11_big_fil_rev_8_21_14_0_20_37_9]
MVMNMDENKKKAILKATINLVKTRTPKEDIEISLKELGLNDEEVKFFLKNAIEDCNKEIDTEPVPEMSVPGKKEEPKKEPAKKENILDFFSKKEGKKEPEKAAPEKKDPKSFIPKLKSGGRKNVQEINEKSFLDAKPEKQEKEKISQPRDLIKKPLLEIKSDAESKSVAESKQPIESSPKMMTTNLDIIANNLGKLKSISKHDSESESVQKQSVSKQPVAKVVSEKPSYMNAELTMLVIPNKDYGKGMTLLARKISRDYNKIVYVNLNELYDNLVNRLRKENIDPKKFYFIDAVTMASVKDFTKHGNCSFVSSPNSLVELSLAISRALTNEKPQALIFDSISTLLIYENETTVTKFIHSLIGKIKAMSVTAFFTALEGDSQTEAIKDLTMFVDNVNTLTEFELGELGVSSGFSAFNQIQQKPVPRAPQPALRKDMNILAKALEAENKKQVTMEKNQLIEGEMLALRKRLDEMQSDRKNELAERIEGKMKKLDSLSSLEKQIAELDKKIGQNQEKPINSLLINQIEKLESKINQLEKKLESKEDVRKNDLEKFTLKQKLELAEKKRELDAMMNDFYAVDPSQVDPKKGISKGLSKKLQGKKKVLDKAYKRGLITTQAYKGGKKRIKGEIKRLEYSAQVASLEKKLDALNEAYDSGIITRDSYVKGKARLEKLLKN